MSNQLDASLLSQVALLPTVISPTELVHLLRWQLQQIANRFYERFTSEYIPQLQHRSKWSTVKPNLQVNDIVLVAEEDTSRGKWPLGIITEVELSSDGLVRAAMVRFNGKEKRRPINKLVFLEHHTWHCLLHQQTVYFLSKQKVMFMFSDFETGLCRAVTRCNF